MEKFGMSFGGGPSRKDLLVTVESQNKQLAQYQSRFRDVVHAYKSLLKEKEALEASLKVLSGSRDADVNRQLCERAALLQDCGDGDVTEEDAAEAGGPDGSEAGSAAAEQLQVGEAERGKVQLKNQLGTLTSALATVMQEKSRMEASFQADKRQLKQEVAQLQERLESATARQQAEVRALRRQLAESRARVITQQHEREQEQSDQLQQLQELQKILQQERDLRQDAELRLHESDANFPAASHAMDRGAESEALLKQTREERDQLRRKLRAAEEEREEADPRVEGLQWELSELDKCLQEQLHNQNYRVCQEEARAHAAELRVAGLEQRVSELSDLLGSCEKARQREQQSTQRLRERLAQLDTENKMLAAGRSAVYDPGPDDSQLDVTALKDKLDKVKKLLLAAQRNPPVRTPSELEPVRGAAQQEELRQLKDELEGYKLRAKAAPKNTVDEGCQAREQLADLREKYINLRVESDKAAVAQRHQLQQQQVQTAALLHGQRQEAERRQGAHRDELLRLEAELHKQRERTVALLDDKDRELERLRAAVPAPNSDSFAQRASQEDFRAEEEEREADAVGRALRHAEPTLLLYAEQLARKEVEVAGLRRQKRQLEDDIRRLHAKLAANAQRHDDETDELRVQLDKLIREQKREGSNVEYLKNVIYKFLTLPDAGGRQQTLNAILGILHFSPQEKDSVLRQQGAPWWSTHKR
ncbi:GRIP and coiled-coil domain-containing protein 1 [Phycodurus eques]|uniref:GRIP and coiled-coil domain-containing protein 1 n=1 Tax=Phycodurus eques TaxID=693459 RepID=UPI002ACE2FF1|nr:GRIP and coiled-coil domain-containing protein 1 [Phycodurus eques]XP_061524483.1 GRIP and coiled-coil domain-containing protein 1 [Phycodurus eques]XP_061524484.1 GRIP and coiled-coil domain-containing protein 1 [Phycodurus eques]